MEHSPQSASPDLPSNGAGITRAIRSEDLAYQAVTVGAILLVLASVWVF
ncbi:MAG: hypothetical protein WCA11_03090 [Terracidiphilus sp.]